MSLGDLGKIDLLTNSPPVRRRVFSLNWWYDHLIRQCLSNALRIFLDFAPRAPLQAGLFILV
jgi:hypothetical protein